MSSSIFKLFLGKPKTSWYRLTIEEREKILAKFESSLNEVGAKRVLMCDCNWSSEQWAYFGVEEFPDMEAVRKHTKLLGEVNWPFEFAESFSILGTKSD